MFRYLKAFLNYQKALLDYQKYYFFINKIRIFTQNLLVSIKLCIVKLLVVDDNPINQKFLFYSLKNIFEIEFANNGLEAVNLLDNKSFDVGLMDLMMPIMDGAEATLRIRKSDNYRNKYIPIIFVTTNDFENDRILCMKNGADDYLLKPINIDNLITTIDFHLKQKQELLY